MRVLVTGGAGFIGSHIVDQLLVARHEVVVVDDHDPAGHDGSHTRLAPDAEHRRADIRDADSWSDALDGVGAVCHQAAKVGLGVDFADVGEYVSRNVAGTATLLRALHGRGFVGRIVIASSMVVYGEGRYRCARHGVVRPGPRVIADLDSGRFEPPCPECGGALDAEAVPEEQPLDPRNVYATTKVAQEHLSASYAREHPGTTVTLLRYHNVYGPRMPRDTPYAGVTSIFRSAYASGVAPRILEDGGQRRDFVHVSDVARANVLALTRDEAAPGPFNVCSGDPHTILEMAVALRPPDGPHPEVVGGYRLGDVRHVFANPTRAATGLGFIAEIGFDDGMPAFATAPLREPAAD
jgi:dTDP-L-rhamnose 4-epimerase